VEIIAEYLNYLEQERKLSFNSLRLYKCDLLAFDEFIKLELKNENYQIKELDADILRQFKSWVERKGKSIATVNRKLTALHGMWTWLRQAGEVERDPFTQIEREGQYRNQTPATLSEEEMQQLLDFPEHNLRTKIILEIIYATGIRVGELILLTLVDIDMDSQLITIARSAKYKERVVPFNKVLKGYLEAYITEHGLETNHKLLFAGGSPSGEEVSEREVFRLIRHAAARAGLMKKVSPSVIRNSFIRHMKQRGAFKVLLRDLTGQKSV
jgi:site-specific recombinase XerD